MIISGFTDEVSNDLGVQIKALKELGWNHIDLRSVDGKNVSTLSDDEFAKVHETLTENEAVFAVPGITDAVHVAAGHATCAVHATGAVSCWGSNEFLGLGDGVAGLKIGMPREYFAEGLDDRIATVIEAAAAGHPVLEYPAATWGPEGRHTPIEWATGPIRGEVTTSPRGLV